MDRKITHRGLIPWSIFGEMDEPHRYLDGIFNTPLFPALWRRFPASHDEWFPALDVYEEEDKFVVKAELPGMKEDDVDVSVNGNTLTIKGEKKSETEKKEETYHYSERTFGSFFRSVKIPTNVDGDKIEAHYEHGVLEISLPKLAESKPRKIEVSAKKEKPSVK